MDFRHIKAFIAVADALSVTKAAERLHISQPPLSRHIHQLEEELGLTLFLRHRHGVTLTEDGKRLLDKARALDAAGTEFSETARQMARGEESRIRIGIGWGLWDVVNRLRVEFTKQHPDMTFEVRDVYCSDRLRGAAEGLDARRRVHETAVRRGDRRCGADLPRAHPGRRRRRQPAGLAGRTCGFATWPTCRCCCGTGTWRRRSTTRVLELYARHGMTPPMVATPGAGPYNHAGLMMVASGKGVYLCLGVPLTSPQPASGVAVLPVGDPGATIEVCVASRKGETSHLVGQFLDCVWEYLPAAAAGCRGAAVAWRVRA